MVGLEKWRSFLIDRINANYMDVVVSKDFLNEQRKLLQSAPANQLVSIHKLLCDPTRDEKPYIFDQMLSQTEDAILKANDGAILFVNKQGSYILEGTELIR